jgi:ABC-type antimicrobial peptide transport system ATPase subunit
VNQLTLCKAACILVQLHVQVTVIHVKSQQQELQLPQFTLQMPFYSALVTLPATQQLQHVHGCALRALCCYACRKPYL